MTVSCVAEFDFNFAIYFDIFYFSLHNTESFLESIELFLKKYKPKYLKKYIIKMDTDTEEFKEKISDPSDKFIDWLLS